MRNAEYTWNDLVNANRTINTTNIKGKEYAEVHQRIKAFRMLCPTGRIETELLSNEGGRCVFKAYVFNSQSELIATGTAYEEESSSYINKTSYIENCETSAVGRALGIAGFGIDTSVASFEEVDLAIKKQEAGAKLKAKPKTKADPEEPAILETFNGKVKLFIKNNGLDFKKCADAYQLTRETTEEWFEKTYNILQMLPPEELEKLK